MLALSAAQIACAAAKSYHIPLFNTACGRIAFLLKSMFVYAVELSENDSQYKRLFVFYTLEFIMFFSCIQSDLVFLCCCHSSLSVLVVLLLSNLLNPFMLIRFLA